VERHVGRRRVVVVEEEGGEGEGRGGGSRVEAAVGRDGRAGKVRVTTCKGFKEKEI
jgi:hypothetical protein